MKRRRGRQVPHRLRTVVVGCSVLLVSLAACGNHDTGDAATVPAMPQPISSLSEADFHAIGVAAGVRALPEGKPLDIALDVSPDQLAGFVADVCKGTDPPFLPTEDVDLPRVAAYEALFDELTRRCQPAGVALDRLRGRVATAIISGERFLSRLDEVSSTDSFCVDLSGHREISSFDIGFEAERLGLRDTQEMQIHFGVSLLLRDCPHLLRQVEE